MVTIKIGEKMSLFSEDSPVRSGVMQQALKISKEPYNKYRHEWALRVLAESCDDLVSVNGDKRI